MLMACPAVQRVAKCVSRNVRRIASAASEANVRIGRVRGGILRATHVYAITPSSQARGKGWANQASAISGRAQSAVHEVGFQRSAKAQNERPAAR